MAFDNVIFDGKTLADLFSDVYKNSENKRAQINQFIASMVKLIRTPEDAAVLGPVVKDFLEVNVKNDEHIVRLVQIAQRLVASGGKEEGSLLTEEEKNQLLKNVKGEFEMVVREQEELDDEFDRLRT